MMVEIKPGTAGDAGAIMTVLVNDDKLKDLMLIPKSDKTNYSKLITNYFIETYVCDTITETSVCRLLIHSMPQSFTSNSYVRNDNIAIEIYVPNSKDRMPGFERRINQIADRLIQLFNGKLINDKKMRLIARNELVSNSTGFRRFYVQFGYKRIYT